MESRIAECTDHSAEISVSGVRNLGGELAQFAKSHSDWLESQQKRGTIVYALPLSIVKWQDQISQLGTLFGIDQRDAEAEFSFSTLCETHRCVGLDQGRLIQYEWLLPRFRPAPISPAMQRLLGWTDSQIETAEEADRTLDHIVERMAGGLGRLVSRHDFFEATEALHADWLAISEAYRPPLPLRRETHPVIKSMELVPLVEQPNEVQAFFERLDDVCRHFSIAGFFDWHLPIPEALTWSTTQDPSRLGETVSQYTPWYFPLEKGDELGRIAWEHHQGLATEWKITDGNSWQTYGRLLLLRHWEHVLTRRYPVEQRDSTFMTNLIGVLAKCLCLSDDTVKALRDDLSALRRGAVSTLKGVRRSHRRKRS